MTTVCDCKDQEGCTKGGFTPRTNKLIHTLMCTDETVRDFGHTPPKPRSPFLDITSGASVDEICLFFGVPARTYRDPVPHGPILLTGYWPADDNAVRLAGRWLVNSTRIGHGSSAYVYPGYDTETESAVVVKIFHPGTLFTNNVWVPPPPFHDDGMGCEIVYDGGRARLLSEMWRLRTQLDMLDSDMRAQCDGAQREYDTHAALDSPDLVAALECEGVRAVVLRRHGMTLYDVCATLAHRRCGLGGMALCDVQHIMAQLTGQLAAMHQCGIIHGDVKRANICVTSHPFGCVCTAAMCRCFERIAAMTPRHTGAKRQHTDGTSPTSIVDSAASVPYTMRQILLRTDVRLIDYSSTHRASSPTDCTGLVTTITERAPEQDARVGSWDAMIDVFSCAATVVGLLTGEPAVPVMKENDTVAHAHALVDLLGPPPVDYLGQLSVRWKVELVMAVVRHNRQREAAGGAPHPASLRARLAFLLPAHADLVDLLVRMMNWDPARRPTMDEVRQHAFLQPANRIPILDADPVRGYGGVSCLRARMTADAAVIDRNPRRHGCWNGPPIDVEKLTRDSPVWRAMTARLHTLSQRQWREEVSVRE